MAEYMDRTEFRMGDEGVNGYQLLNSLVVPRAIAWVSSVDEQGRVNLAPHSFFTVASADPPSLLFTSVGEKDTLRNVRATGEFTVSVASAPQLHAINDSSAPFEPGESEHEHLGIRTEPAASVSAPRVADSPAAMECRLDRIVEVGTNYLVIGTVTVVAVGTHALDGKHPMMEHLQPLSRLGINEWGLPPEVFAIDRPRTVDDVRSGPGTDG